MNDNDKTEQAPALMDRDGAVWGLASNGNYRFATFWWPRDQIEAEAGPVTELWPRETHEPGDRSEALTTLLDSYHIGSGCSMELGRYRITQDPEPGPEMVTATYPGDTWERVQEVAAMEGATAARAYDGATTLTGPVSIDGPMLEIGNYRWFAFDELSIREGSLTVTAPKPVEPERPEWADALVVRVADGGVWARSGDGLWVEAGMPAELIEDIYNSAEIAAVGPVTVLVDADGQVVV